MADIICNHPTLDGTPCQNPVTVGTGHCSAGHPVDLGPALVAAKSPSGGQAADEGTIELDEVLVDDWSPFPATYAVSVTGLHEAVQIWDEDYGNSAEPGPRQWGEFVGDEYYAATFINHLAEWDAWTPIGGMPTISVWAEHDDAYGADPGVILHLSRVGDTTGASITSPRIYVTPHYDDWSELPSFAQLGITEETDLAEAVGILGKYQARLIQSAPGIEN